jgi:hypothetical protein
MATSRLTRAAFQLIAETIQSLEHDGFDAGARWAIAKAFAQTLRATNPNFNADRFIDVARGLRKNPGTLRHNPPLVTFANPRRSRFRRNGAAHYAGQDAHGLWLELQVVGQLSRRVFEIRYKHLADGQNYKHKFKPNVCMEALHDGSIRVYGRNGQPVVGDF